MEFIRWLGTLALGAAIGIGATDAYDRYHRSYGDRTELTAAIVDAAIHLGWECARDGQITLDGCRQLAAGVQKIGN